MDWLVIEDISGDVPRLEAVHFDPYVARLLIQSVNVRALWRIHDDSKEEAIKTVAEIFRRKIIDPKRMLYVLKECDWNVSKAAEIMEIDLKTIYRNFSNLKIWRQVKDKICV